MPESWLGNSIIFAASEPSPGAVLLMHVVSGVVFSIIGLVVFAVALWLIVRIMPFSVRKEIEEDQNTALGVIIGAVMIGFSIIIAAAIQG